MQNGCCAGGYNSSVEISGSTEQVRLTVGNFCFIKEIYGDIFQITFIVVAKTQRTSLSFIFSHLKFQLVILNCLHYETAI